MVLNNKSSFRNKNTLKLQYESQYYFLDVSEDFYDNHHTWDKIKVKYLKGHSTVFFPEYKFSDQKIVIDLFYGFGIFCLILAFNIFPKFNEWFEREKIFKSHF